MHNTAQTLSNAQARRIWLHLQDMLTAPQPTGAPLGGIDTVRQLGMVQLDSINSVVRAQHHILWSRNSAYREADYNAMLGNTPLVFEHFSHDAAILPLDTYPYWQRQHKRRAAAFKRGAWGKQLASPSVRKKILSQIEQCGPMCSRDFAKTYTQKADRSLHPWMRPPHKLALDYLWLKGELCVSHRQGFIKYYDLAERIIPACLRQQSICVTEQVDFLCHSALERLGFASAADIQRFYGACELAEVKHWLKRNEAKIIAVNIEKHDGKSVEMYAQAQIMSLVKKLPEPSRQLRIISPFDPLIRDRARMKMLFGTQYRIEIFTPAAKRRYGYYVYPILEGDKITARIDVRANRDLGVLEVNAWWLEPGVKPTKGRFQRLRSELNRLARLAAVSRVNDIPEPSNHPGSA